MMLAKTIRKPLIKEVIEMRTNDLYGAKKITKFPRSIRKIERNKIKITGFQYFLTTNKIIPIIIPKEDKKEIFAYSLTVPL